MEKTLKSKEKSGLSFMSQNIGLGGLALILTAGLIYYGKPENIFVLTTRYMGDPVMLSSVLAVIGVLSALLGYVLRRIYLCS